MLMLLLFILTQDRKCTILNIVLKQEYNRTEMENELFSFTSPDRPKFSKSIFYILFKNLKHSACYI
jgi:hypothetical protein